MVNEQWCRGGAWPPPLSPPPPSPPSLHVAGAAYSPLPSAAHPPSHPGRCPPPPRSPSPPCRALSSGPPLLEAFVAASSSPLSCPAGQRERCCLLARTDYDEALLRPDPDLPDGGRAPDREPVPLQPFRLHQTWATVLQLAVSLAVRYDAVSLGRLAAVASVAVTLLTVAINALLARHQQSVQSELMTAHDIRLNALSESLTNMKALKIYAWESHFREAMQGLWDSELWCLSTFQTGRAYTSVVFWASPAFVSATFTACWFPGIPLGASNVFALVAALWLVQDPFNRMPDVVGAVIQATVSFSRIAEFLSAPELQYVRLGGRMSSGEHGILIKSGSFSWEYNSDRPSLSNIDLEVKSGEKVAISGEVGSGKSTLLGAVLGDVPRTYGEEYVIGPLARKTVILVTHQVEPLHAFDYIRVAQNSWLAANVQTPRVSTLRLVTVYVSIGLGSVIFLLLRALSAVGLGLQTSESLFSDLLTTLFRAPAPVFNYTPLARLLSWVCSDLSIMDLVIPFSFAFRISVTMNVYGILGMLVFATWQVLLVGFTDCGGRLKLEHGPEAAALPLLHPPVAEPDPGP